MILLLCVPHIASSTEIEAPTHARHPTNTSSPSKSLASLLPLWSPLSRWERVNGPQYRELWRQLPILPGVYATALAVKDANSKGLGDCKALANAPANTTAVVWSGIAVAFRHFFGHSGCAELVAAVENRSSIIAFEPLYTGSAGCPRLQQRQPGVAKYLTVPYPSQFHARSDQAVREHLATVASVHRPHLAAYFGGLHGRQVELRTRLRVTCREAAPRCADLAPEDEPCSDPRHQSAGSLESRCEAIGIHEKDTGAFGRILYGYMHAEFCLMPGGDTPTRQGVMDALLVGCIPVFFATCSHGSLYEVAYHPFIPQYDRKAWGAGDWSVLLNSTRVLNEPSTLMTDLEAISPETRQAMRARISTFIPQLQYSAPGVQLHDFADAQHVFARIVPQAHELILTTAAPTSSNAAGAFREAHRSPDPPDPSSFQRRSTHTGDLTRHEACEAEKTFELERDRRLAALVSLPQPFPLDEEFETSLETPQECAQLLKGLRGTSPRVLVAIEAYKQIAMVRRVVKRLSYRHSVGFLLHLASDVSIEFAQAVRALASSTSNVCVIRSGYIVYRTSTDMRILHSTWRWLERESSLGWDFFISLSGADYPAVDGATLRGLLAQTGNVSWRLPERGMTAGQANRSMAWPVPGMRFHDYGLGCEATRNYTRVRGRHNWLARLVPEMTPRWTVPYSSGGIFHRDTIRFLIHDARARAAYMFFRLFPTAGVEHYWATVYTLPDLAPLLTNRTIVSCHMQWLDDGGGRLEHKGTGGTAHNTFLGMDQWTNIEREIKRCTPFLRKFDAEMDLDVLDRIDVASRAQMNACSFPES